VHDDVVGTVEPLAVVGVGEDRDGAVELGARHAPRAVLAAHKPPLRVHRVPVRVARRDAEGPDPVGHLVVAQHPVVRDVAPHEVAASGEVRRPLGPAAAVEEPVEPGAGLDEGTEARVEDLEDVAHGRD
jgi:hypothetical protein